jgi:hypothetical protein
MAKETPNQTFRTPVYLENTENNNANVRALYIDQEGKVQVKREGSVIFQDVPYTRLVESFEDLIKIFDKGSSSSGTVPIFEGKSYEFELTFVVTTNSLVTEIFFGMLGDTANVENVRYTSECADFDVVGGTVARRRYSDFDKNSINDLVATVSNIYAKIVGTFKCTADGYLQPSVCLDSDGFNTTTTIGSNIKVNEIETSSDIV